MPVARVGTWSIPATAQKLVRVEYKGLVFDEPLRFHILVNGELISGLPLMYCVKFLDPLRRKFRNFLREPRITQMAQMTIRSERSVRFALITNCAILYEPSHNMRRCSHGAVRRVGRDSE